MSAELVLYDEMCRAIAAAYEVDEVKEIRDKALAIEVYSRQAHNVENEKRAIEIRIRAERRCGELLAEMEKAKAAPGNQYTGPIPRSDRSKTLADFGISPNQSSRWQKLAKIPDDEFEATFRQPGKPSTSGIIASHPEQPAPAPPSKKNVVDDLALWLWGRLLDFEREGLLNKDPNEVCAIGKSGMAMIPFPTSRHTLQGARRALAAAMCCACPPQMTCHTQRGSDHERSLHF